MITLPFLFSFYSFRAVCTSFFFMTAFFFTEQFLSQLEYRSGCARVSSCCNRLTLVHYVTWPWHSKEVGHGMWCLYRAFQKSRSVAARLKRDRFLGLQKIDWEAELAIVIGKKGKALNNDNAEDCIFGYTVAQDITARDWSKTKRNGGQFLLGKAMDTFCPLGPAVVTKEAICDINNLSVRTWVNGELKQDGNTSEFIVKPHEIVIYLSQFVFFTTIR